MSEWIDAELAESQMHDKRHAVVLLIGISSMLYFEPKLKAVDEQADDEIVHLGGLREADRLAHQALDAGAQRQVLALQLLGMVFPHCMEPGIEMALVRAPASAAFFSYRQKTTFRRLRPPPLWPAVRPCPRASGCPAPRD